MRHALCIRDQTIRVPAAPRLTKAQNAKLRDVTRRMVVEKYDGVASRMAAALEIGQPTISRILSGKQGTTEQVAAKILQAAGESLEEFGLAAEDAPASARRPGLLGTLPNWAQAEATARQLAPHLPDAAWVAARRLSSEIPLLTLSPGVVLHLAMAIDLAQRQAS